MKIYKEQYMKQCDKQCLTKLINGDTSKCNYYSNNRCLIDEYQDNYLFKQKRRKT